MMRLAFRATAARAPARDDGTLAPPPNGHDGPLAHGAADARPVTPIERALCSPRFLGVLVTIGVALRVWAYAANTALWLDEILLSRNVLGLPLRELVSQPLRLDQVAPRGFLLMEKLAVLAFGESELTLRLFPFLCGIAALLLFRRLAARALDGLAVPFAVALFALGVPFISYAVQVKQYMVDATAAILILHLALGLRGPRVSTRQLLLVGLFGWVVIWFSQASVLVMGGIGIAFGVEWLVRRDRATARALLITMPLWATAAVVAVIAGMRSMTPATREFMDDFWRPGFFPLPLRSPAQLRWFWDQGMSVFDDPSLLRYPLPAVYLLLALVGVAALWPRRRDVALVLLGPVGVALLAAIAHQYPFRGRLMFYLLPGFILGIAAGVEWIRRTARRASSALGIAVMAALAAPPVAALSRAVPPYEIEHHRTMLAHLQRNRQPGDVVYVFPLSRIGVLFYGPQYGLTRDDWATATCNREDTRAYIRDVDRYRGVRRLWVLSARVRPFRAAYAAVRQYLGTIGVRRDSLSRRSLNFAQVSLDLYDLTDPARLAAASAETFPVPPMPTDPRPGCRPWARPSPLDDFR